MTRNYKMKALSYAVTGANGFVGSTIADFLRSKKYKVYEIGRHPSRNIQGMQYFIHYSLEDAIDKKKLKKIDVIIHCAYDFQLTKWKDIERVNVNGSINLLREAHSAGVKRIIFISTMCAFEGCKSMYGNAKTSVEKEAAKLGAIIVRPNMVFGNGAGGSIGSLNRQIALSKFIPLIGGSSKLHYLCHKDDLAYAVLELSLAKKDINAPVVAASEKGHTFKNILKILAGANGKKIFIVPIPYWATFLALRILEILKINIGLRSDSLVSLVDVNQNADFGLTRELGLKFREFNAQTANQ